MPFLPDTQTTTIDQFNGAWLPSEEFFDSTKIPLSNGQFSQNAQYFGNGVATRFGFASAFNPSAAISALLNWLFLNGTTPANYLVWFKPGTGLQYADLASPSASTIISQGTAATASIQPWGARLYVGFMDSNGIGVAPGQVYGYGVGAEVLFAPPLVTPPVMTDLGGSLTTPGAKNFGYLIQTKNGFITRPSKQDATTNLFTATSFTSTGGAIQITVDPPAHAWPSYASKVAAIMTATANPNQYFIAPQWTSPNLTGVTNVVIVAGPDDYITSNWVDATPYFGQLSQTVSGTSPIQPSVIFTYGQRLAYICLDAAGIPVCYFSDSSQPQSANAGTSGVYLPGQLQITTGCAIDGTAYLFGPHWTYATTDNQGTPATWAQPKVVSGSIGAGGPFCVSANQARGYAWVADQNGLYYFAGQYQDRPVSYWQTADWERINFAAATKIMVSEDTTNQRVIVLAPLDGATSPTHMLTWDYSLGTTPEQVQYSIWSIGSYAPGAIAPVQNNTSRRTEIWVGPSSGSYPVGRMMSATDANNRLDFSNAIDSIWETGPMPRGLAGALVMHHGANVRLRGSGRVTLTAYGLDHSASAGPFDITSDASPGTEILQRFFLNSEYASLRFESSDTGAWFQLSRVDHFWTPGMPQQS